MAETAEPNPTINPPDRRKLIAVLYADMVGYSRLIGLDDVGTLQRLRALRANLIDPAVAEYGGTVVQTGGDSLLIVFDSVDGAMRCAVKLQQRVPVLDGDQPPDRAIRFRIGINIGDAIADGTDLHGDAVNVAARLQAECPPGGLCISRSVRDHVHQRLDLAFEELGQLHLKNIAHPVEAFVVKLDTPRMPHGMGNAGSHADMPLGDEAKRRLAGILAADVVGYSAMVGADEPGTLARVRALRTDVIEPLAVAHGGRLFKTPGDGFFVEFVSTVQALRCAIAIQDMLRARTDGLRLRIGVHQGEVVPEGDDLMGDGVVIASRLEPLAEPGGICISSRVRENVSGKMALEVDDLGEHPLKNITTRIGVFRVRLSAVERTPLPLPDKPSLVVLPFQNMSGEPEQEYFTDGMVEDITTALSRIRSLFVIARNSAYTYKGRAVDVRQVGRELGVHYVLEGSVRKAGSRVRITGQLVDAANGSHLWADRFDGTLEDVFDLQDQVTASVVAAIQPNLLEAEIQRAQRKPTENLQAYDLVLRSSPLLLTRSRESLAEAARLLRRAIEIDPGYAPALSALASCHWTMVSQSWMDRANPAVNEMIHLAQAALALDGNDPVVLQRVSWIIALPGGDLNGGIALINKSIDLNPNSAAAREKAGMLFAYAGDKQSAITQLERSVRLNPINRTLNFYFAYALAHFVAGEHEAAVEWTGKALQHVPNHSASLRYRAASLGLLSRLEEGRQVVQRLLELVPDFTIARARCHIEFDMNNIFKTPGVADSFYEGLRRSGVPE